MPIAAGNRKLVLQGYSAWLHENGLEKSPESAKLFAELMTNSDDRDYEGMTEAEVQIVSLSL